MSSLRDLALPGGRTVSAACLDVRYARSSGPGGQRVNKVETKVDVRLDLVAAGVFSPTELGRIRRRLENRLDADGRLQVVSQVYRDKSQNLEDALVRLEGLLADALFVQKARRATRPSRGAKERRLAAKKRRGDVKRGRGSAQDD